MPFTHRIDMERWLIEVTFSGPVVAQDLADARARVRADPDYQPGLRLLLDIRPADLAPLQGGQLRQRAQDPPTVARIAIVVSTALAYGMARMYELAGAGSVAVFHHYDEAIAWLTEDNG